MKHIPQLVALWLLLVATNLFGKTLIYPPAALDDLVRLGPARIEARWKPRSIPDGYFPIVEGYYVVYNHENLSLFFGPVDAEPEVAKIQTHLENIRRQLISQNAALSSSTVGRIKIDFGGESPTPADGPPPEGLKPVRVLSGNSALELGKEEAADDSTTGSSTEGQESSVYAVGSEEKNPEATSPPSGSAAGQEEVSGEAMDPKDGQETGQGSSNSSNPPGGLLNVFPGSDATGAPSSGQAQGPSGTQIQDTGDPKTATDPGGGSENSGSQGDRPGEPVPSSPVQPQGPDSLEEGSNMPGTELLNTSQDTQSGEPESGPPSSQPGQQGESNGDQEVQSGQEPQTPGQPGGKSSSQSQPSGQAPNPGQASAEGPQGTASETPSPAAAETPPSPSILPELPKLPSLKDLLRGSPTPEASQDTGSTKGGTETSTEERKTGNPEMEPPAKTASENTEPTENADPDAPAPTNPAGQKPPASSQAEPAAETQNTSEVTGAEETAEEEPTDLPPPPVEPGEGEAVATPSSEPATIHINQLLKRKFGAPLPVPPSRENE